MKLYTDKLLRVSIVAEVDGQLWMVPRRAGGWAGRLRLQLTDQARSERLTVAKGIDPAWLGLIPENSESRPPGCAVSSAEGAGRPVTRPAAGCVKRASRGQSRKRR
jgi:hypothetical protein